MEIRVQVEAVPSNPFTQYYSMATQALYYYDYFLTLPDEVLSTPYLFYNFFIVIQVKYAWNGRKTWGEFVCRLALFILTRPVFVVFLFVSRLASALSAV